MKSIKKSTREDGEETKARLIECAGRLIADQGFDRTTSKDICRLAGTNLAAVNYHFGSREGLYKAVLDEVYHYVISPVEIDTIYHRNVPPREKLMELLDLYVKEALFSESWQVKVSIRELINPSAIFSSFAESYIGRKLTPVLDMLSAYLDIPADDPRVPRAFLTALSPFLIFLLSGHRQMGLVMYGLSRQDKEQKMEEADMLKEFVFAGLDRLKEKWGREEI